MGKLKKSFHVPKDVHDVQSLVAQGYDPLHAVYIAVQNITSVFAECVSVLPELKSYYKTVGDAEEEYMPAGPPMSPLTRSYFTTWAFFDFRFGGDHETIGTCLTRSGRPTGHWILAWSRPSASFKSPAWAFTSIAARLAARSVLRNWSLAGSCPASARRLHRQARRTLVCSALPAAGGLGGLPCGHDHALHSDAGDQDGLDGLSQPGHARTWELGMTSNGCMNC